MNKLTFGEVKAEEVKVFDVKDFSTKSVFLIYLKINDEFVLIPTKDVTIKSEGIEQVITDIINLPNEHTAYYHASNYYEAIIKAEKIKEQLQERYYESIFEALLKKEINEEQSIEKIVEEGIALFSSHLPTLTRCIDKKLSEYQYKPFDNLVGQHENELKILEGLQSKWLKK